MTPLIKALRKLGFVLAQSPSTADAVDSGDRMTVTALLVSRDRLDLE